MAGDVSPLPHSRNSAAQRGVRHPESRDDGSVDPGGVQRSARGPGALTVTRVGLLNDLAIVGGGQTVMLQVAEALRDGGMEPHLISPPGPLASASLESDIPSYAFPLHQRTIL